jgi:hypothetical protein
MAKQTGGEIFLFLLPSLSLFTKREKKRQKERKHKIVDLLRESPISSFTLSAKNIENMGRIC